MAASLTVGTLPLLYVPPTPLKPPHLQPTRYVVRSLAVVAQWFSVPSIRRIINIRHGNLSRVRFRACVKIHASR